MKFCLTRKHAIELLYVVGLCNGQVKFYDVCSGWLKNGVDDWCDRDMPGSLLRYYF